MSQFTSEEFLQSFLVEADEYLQTILHTLLELEKKTLSVSGQKSDFNGVEESEVILALMNDLLRSLHSLKGISGMVGLIPAAELCHAMESVLKPIQQEQRSFSPRLIDRLIKAGQLMEQILQTVRDPSLKIPEIDGIIADLTISTEPEAMVENHLVERELASSAPFTSLADQEFPPDIARQLGPNEMKKIQAALSSGKQIAIAYYEPTKEQHQEGHNVNHVRELISQHTILIKAVPIIQQGTVRFAFVTASDQFPPAEQLRFLDWQPISRVAGIPAPLVHGTHDTSLQVTGNTPGSAASSSPTLRVELSRMDDLMKLVGDLVVTRSRITDLLPHLTGANPVVLESLEESIEKLERQIRYLRQAVMRMRLVPLAEIFSRMPLTVRDLAHSSGKKVRLVVDGSDTELDKSLVERLADPLMHIVRNAITHGIEPPEVRQATGKLPEGTIRLVGKAEGDHVRILVEDDGQGINVVKVQEKAKALGWLTGDELLTSQEVLEILCRPGFSTREIADQGAGRGMGMNAAAEAISRLGGSLSLETQPGLGTCFIIQLPLTITIIDAFLVKAGGELFAFPQSIVKEIIEIFPDQMTQFQGRYFLPYRGNTITLFRLTDVLGFPPSPGNRVLGLVIGRENRQTAILVDQVLGLRETVVHPITDPLIARPGISGVTELGDGSVILILDGNELSNNLNVVSSTIITGE